jgi:hypothetical protein
MAELLLDALRNIGYAKIKSKPWPPHCELDDRQKRKYLPFRKLQPQKKIKGFGVLSHSLSPPHRHVLQILSTNWPQVFGVNPFVETVSIGPQ